MAAWPANRLVVRVAPVAWAAEIGLRVVVCLHERHLGGATRSVERIVPLLSEFGWEFSFWAPKPSDLYDEFKSRGWDVDGAPRAFEYSLRALRLPPGIGPRVRAAPDYVRRYRRFLSERRPAIVHANSVLTMAEALLARRRGIPTMLHVHEMLPRDLRGRMLRRAAWTRLDQVVAVSRPSASRLAWRGRTPRIVYESTPVPSERVAIRSDPRPFTVGTVAVVSTRKGSDLFVDAASRLLANGNGRFQFEMVGDAHDAIERDWARQLLARARAAGVKHVPTTDVFERLREWDAFVLPSRSDPFPISMLEAMASGLPVVGSRRDGIAEQIAAGTGLLVEPEDPSALADAISWCATQPPETRDRLGAAARERVTSAFTHEHQAAALHTAYEATLAAAASR
ncbi:MAG: glycosyltransferase family 4 protein [Vicinamibacteria bacterium]|jgi:glycosyltransferase involved in cell wall biosynthesis